MVFEANVSIYFLLVVLVFTVSMGFYVNYRYVIFRRNARTGDQCRFIHENQDRVGKIVQYDNDNVIIESDSYVFRRRRNEIWPVGL